MPLSEAQLSGTEVRTVSVPTVAGQRETSYGTNPWQGRLVCPLGTAVGIGRTSLPEVSFTVLILHNSCSPKCDAVIEEVLHDNTEQWKVFTSASLAFWFLSDLQKTGAARGSHQNCNGWQFGCWGPKGTPISLDVVIYSGFEVHVSVSISVAQPLSSPHFHHLIGCFDLSVISTCP